MKTYIGFETHYYGKQEVEYEIVEFDNPDDALTFLINLNFHFWRDGSDPELILEDIEEKSIYARIFQYDSKLIVDKKNVKEKFSKLKLKDLSGP